MMIRKSIRVLGISLALVALLVFTTGVVSDWNHRDSSTDARCPYCHLGHQTPSQTEDPLCVAALNPVESLLLLDDVIPAKGPVLSQIAPRAPPLA